MAEITEGRRAGEFIVSEANGSRSREVITIMATSGPLSAGTVLGKITSANAASVAAATGNTGDALTFASVTVSNDAISGSYSLEVLTATDGGTAGTFRVTDPFGASASGTFGVAFSALGIGFTASEESTAVADVGDLYTITVTEGAGEYVPFQITGADDGRRTAAAILYDNVDATSADVQAVAIVRDAEVNANDLVWHASVTDDHEATATASLATAGIIVRA